MDTYTHTYTQSMLYENEGRDLSDPTYSYKPKTLNIMKEPAEAR